MRREDIDEAVQQAKLFIARAEHLVARAVAEAIPAHARIYTSSFPKESAALRRTSMELTRALAQMRQSK